jgi:hypothetical protein
MCAAVYTAAHIQDQPVFPYGNLPAAVVKVLVIFPSNVITAAVTTTATNATIRAYSTIVAPSSSLMKLTIFLITVNPPYREARFPENKNIAFPYGILPAAVVKVLVILPSSVITAAETTTATSATIRAYSTIVAPSSSLKKLISFFIFHSPFVLVFGCWCSVYKKTLNNALNSSSFFSAPPPPFVSSIPANPFPINFKSDEVQLGRNSHAPMGVATDMPHIKHGTYFPSSRQGLVLYRPKFKFAAASIIKLQ